MTIFKSPLKWAGGKSQHLDKLRKVLPRNRKKLVEPFVGGGSVFLNIMHGSYLLSDSNRDLIDVFSAIKSDTARYLAETKEMFVPENNTDTSYYGFRDEFNSCTSPFRRAVLFLYLNRHGYNGLCRYNLSGKYNVPFGRYKKVYYPEFNILYARNVLERAELAHGDFEEVFELACPTSVYYCDPPYTPWSKTANFTSYKGGFTEEDHLRLVSCAEKVSGDGTTVVISNHHIEGYSREILYPNADDYIVFEATRNIGCKGHTRHRKIQEVLAVYKGK